MEEQGGRKGNGKIMVEKGNPTCELERTVFGMHLTLLYGDMIDPTNEPKGRIFEKKKNQQQQQC